MQMILFDFTLEKQNLGERVDNLQKKVTKFVNHSMATGISKTLVETGCI